MESGNCAISNFIGWEKASRDCLDFKRCYVDMTQDLIAGLLLSQIVYWHLPDSYGNSKLRVEKKGYLWLAKARFEWWDECRITPKQFDRACVELEQRQLIATDVFKFAGNPTKHIRLNWDVFLRLLDDAVMNVPKNPYLPKGKNQEDKGIEGVFPKNDGNGIPGLFSFGSNPYSQKVNNVLTQSETLNLPFGQSPLTEITAQSTTKKTSKISENDSQILMHGDEVINQPMPLSNHPCVATENRFRAYTRKEGVATPWKDENGGFSAIAIEGVLMNYKTLPGVFFPGTQEPNLGKVNQILKGALNKGELDKLNDFCISGKKSLEIKEQEKLNKQERTAESDELLPDNFDEWYAIASRINPMTGRQCTHKSVLLSGKVQITIQHPVQMILSASEAMQKYPIEFWEKYLAERQIKFNQERELELAQAALIEQEAQNNIEPECIEAEATENESIPDEQYLNDINDAIQELISGDQQKKDNSEDDLTELLDLINF